MAIGTKIPLVNLRETRARQLSAAVMSALDGHICDHSRREAYEALFDLFTANGAEVLTDCDRQQAGFSARGPNGWTMEELMAWEKRKLELLTKPLAPIVLMDK